MSTSLGNARGCYGQCTPSKHLGNRAPYLRDVPRRGGRARTDDDERFLATPMYRLVDRHRAILEKIRTREDAEYWGHMLIGEYYPDIPNSRSASGKLAALVGLTSYMDFYCAWGCYDLLKEGKNLEEARRILGERMARGVKEFKRLLGSQKRKQREIRGRVGAKADAVIPKHMRSAFRLGPGSEVTLPTERSSATT